MKEAFTTGNVITAPWTPNLEDASRLGFPIVAKHIHGSRGTGNTLLQTQQELQAWARNKTLPNYIFEKFKDFSREYRLHVTRDGCFYTCRKMLRSGIPDNQRWYRNDSNCVWVLETNPQFDKPTNWDAIVAESVKALISVGLDIGAIDVKIQSRLDSRDRLRRTPEFIILETNSAPSFGEITLQKYLQQIPRVLRQKFLLS
jgi:glutathione synthase/RimK-type ligase-like ATP-grasp enzyme